METLNIMLVLRWEYAFDRDAFMGVARTAQSYGRVFLYRWSPEWSLIEGIAQAQASGLIISRSNTREVEQIRALGLPCVNIANAVGSHPIVPVVGNDDAAVGETAAEYYLRRGFKYFAYVAPSDIEYFNPRRDGFMRALAMAGHQCASGPPPAAQVDNSPALTFEKHLAQWLATQPRPLAVFCPYDSYAVHTIHVCEQSGLRVPEEVSVIGVDDDPLLCMSSWPAVSSVKTAAARIGSTAFELLRDLIAGRPKPADPLLLPPSGVVTRGSTIEQAIYDADVAAALGFIKANLRQRLTVDDVTDHVAVSRRTLERKFDAALGHTPLQEIRRARVAQAKRLLIETDLSLAEVARRSGFLWQQRLTNVFRKEFGATPSQFRASLRSRSASAPA